MNRLRLKKAIVSGGEYNSNDQPQGEAIKQCRQNLNSIKTVCAANRSGAFGNLKGENTQS